jgi:hypothetical protein
MKNFADTSAFNAGVKEKNTKANKITIAKNQKLATQNFLFNMDRIRTLSVNLQGS